MSIAPALQQTLAQLAHTRRRLEATHRLPSQPRPSRPIPVPELERGPVWMAPLDSIVLAPERFQFRLGHGLDGTCRGRLEACPKWSQALAGSLLVWRSEDQLFLLDGHHRLSLAKRDGIPAVAVLAVEAENEIEARTLAAVANVAAGTAGTVEFARLLRDQNLTLRDLPRLYGLDRRSKTLADAGVLQGLEPDLFSRVCTGEVVIEQALALAAAPDHALQRRIWAMATQRHWQSEQITEAVALASLAPCRTDTPADCLPGFEALLAESNPLIDQQLSVRAAIRRQLRIENHACRLVSRKRAAAALEGRGVASIDQDAAAAARGETGALLKAFAALAGYSGPLAEAIADLAEQVADGADLTRLVEATMPMIRAILSSELT